MFGLDRFVVIGIALVGLVALIVSGVAVIYSKGEKAATAAVTSAVEHTTNVTLEKTRVTKEKSNATVRDLPDDAVVDLTK